MQDRRQSSSSTPLGYLDRLPARLLLDRLPTPMCAIYRDNIVYANRAFEQLLGHSAGDLVGRAAATLLDDDADRGDDIASMLRDCGGEPLALRQADGFIVKPMVSPPMLVRADDPITLLAFHDVTDVLWERVTSTTGSPNGCGATGHPAA